MGAIHVPVGLTNAIDAALVRRGVLPEDQVRSYQGTALVDTGAIRSVIPIHVLESLGLRTWGQRVAEYADGRQEAVGISEPMVFNVLGRETVEEALVLGDEVLIGQTVLEKLDLLADCDNQRLIPNPAHPDQPVSVVK
jgi:clan AA aspartic protease